MAGEVVDVVDQPKEMTCGNLFDLKKKGFIKKIEGTCGLHVLGVVVKIVRVISIILP